MKTRIHVNQHKIKANAKDGGTRPVITVKTYRTNTYCHQVEVLGPSRVIYSPDKPLSCGARVWIETDGEIITKPGGKHENEANAALISAAPEMLAALEDILEPGIFHSMPRQSRAIKRAAAAVKKAKGEK